MIVLATFALLQIGHSSPFSPRSLPEGRTPATDSKVITCWLKNGDRLSGRFITARRTYVRLTHQTLGRLTLPRKTLATCEASDSTIQRRLATLYVPGEPKIVILDTTEMILPVGAPPVTMPLVVARPIPPEALARRPVVVEVPLAAAVATSVNKVGWKRTVSMSYTVSSGNARSNDLGFVGGATRRAERSQIAFQARRLLGKRNGESAVDFLSMNVRYDRALGRPDAAAANRPSFFSESIYERDPFAKLDRRVVANTGLSIPLAFDPTKNLALEVGLGVNHEKFETRSADTRMGGVLRLAARQTFGITKANQQISTFPDFSDQTVKYRINSDFNISAPISTKLSLRLGLTNRYNTSPQAKVKRSDTTIQSGLGFEF